MRYFISRLAIALVSLPLYCGAESLSVKEFRRLAPRQGKLEITGYIARQYRCLPCPSDVKCKPCMRSNVLVSSKEEILQIYPSEGDYIVVFVESPESLVLGKSYRMKVKVLGTETTGYKIRDLELETAVEQ